MDAKAAFAEAVEKLPRQHLRTRFRSRFGTGEGGFDEHTFARGSAAVPLDRRIGHLLQEEPEDLKATIVEGTNEALKARTLQVGAEESLDALLAGSEGERLVVLHGRSANLYAYFNPGEEVAWVRRVAVPRESRPGAKPPAPVLSRRQRAAAAGKTKPVKRPRPKGRGR